MPAAFCFPDPAPESAKKSLINIKRKRAFKMKKPRFGPGGGDHPGRRRGVRGGLGSARAVFRRARVRPGTRTAGDFSVAGTPGPLPKPREGAGRTWETILMGTVHTSHTTAATSDSAVVTHTGSAPSTAAPEAMTSAARVSLTNPGPQMVFTCLAAVT